ncbi:sigma-E factor negative regulatory protein [Caldichromatium japonicum]|uniref:Sigma-E factor negative regulatory protein n=1 Tax=Caldichromatium japonicum TaxID=2699430 RepID=A0A6G7VB80_9GAMM|nr:sigma-E factor negative regulatory protein [Caldichromatium japonicum]QIK37108.1 sigma-E factor negative regulatory protein [Caldichromatium japonicum]
MSEEYRQRLSELQDGELAEQQINDLLDAVASDPALRACWERYALIGQALRGEGIDPGVRILAERVRSVVQTAPVIGTPAQIHPWPRHAPHRLTTWALAASVVLVAVLALPLIMQDRSRLQTSPSLAARLPQQSPEVQRWQIERPEFASKLDRYLVTHQAAAPATAAQGFLPYVTLVSHPVGR